MAASPLRVGTRGSTLALAQAGLVRDTLAATYPDRDAEITIIKTTGDRVQDVPLSHIGGTGAFTGELEAALRDGRIDVAVHSLKDLPTAVPADLCLGAVFNREDVRDALFSKHGQGLDALPEGAIVGTSSARRKAQLLVARPDLRIRDIRGNVETRLQKVRTGDYDATVLAYAGLYRLGRADEISEILPTDVMLPAPGQGAIGIECRNDDEWRELLDPLHDRAVAACVRAERAFLDACGGGCHVPVGALGQVDGDELELRAVIAALDGSDVFWGTETDTIADPEALGRDLARDVLSNGAARIIDAIVQERNA